MAEGGVASTEELSVYIENIQEQSDEIEVLCSIFEADPDRVEILSRVEGDVAEMDINSLSSMNMVKIYVPIQSCEERLHVDVFLPADHDEYMPAARQNGTKVSLVRSESGQRVIWGFDITYLPPISLRITLPHSYPSSDPPSFIISCSWLSPQQLSAVCRELDRLWYENKTPDMPGMPILYTWLDWLQESLLKFLGIDDHLSVTAHRIDNDIDDCRVSVETEDLNEIVTSIVRYNREQEVKEFFKQDHECEICFERLPGDKFYMLLECDHFLCKECMKAHCNLLVAEGTVQNLRCASYKCTSSIPPYILQDVLSEDQFKRYDTLALQKALDVMGDITYCPRCNNVVVREPEQDLNLGHCLRCLYSFCTECEEAWHQGTMCQIMIERLEKELAKKKLTQRDLDRERKEKEEREKLAKLHKIENSQSKNYIKDWTKPCPKCNAKIMKTGGCNFVHCSICNVGMCWICGKSITSYSHFADNSKCNTFEYGDRMIDNTDMQLVNLMYRNAPVRPPPPQPVVRNWGKLIEARLKVNPDLIKNILRCVTCKQKNLKKTENNHVRCWNCGCQICFACKQAITGPVGKHFSGVNSCPQHSRLEFVNDFDDDDDDD